jgi:uncharacterized protein
MTLPRKTDILLQSWWKRPDRKPLILRGARQTGKSTAVQQLGQESPLFLELNLERHSDLALVRTCHSAEELLQRLQQQHNLSTLPPGTLLFLDEIQEHPAALAWLRFFREDFPQLAVIAAGSLLEVRLRDQALPFPVGRVEFLRLEPFTFLEFLAATGDNRLDQDLRHTYANPEGIETGLHSLAMERFRTFLLVGGMPEAVAKWASTQSLVEVAHIHDSLQQAYLEDLLKYGLRSGTSTLQAVLAAAPAFYGSRFKVRDLVVGLKDRALTESLDLLEKAMVLHRARPSSRFELPLVSRPKAAHKLLPLDIGLALAQLGIRPEHLAETPVETLLQGRIAEAFVGVQLLARQPQRARDLHFWIRESSSTSVAEVDYLLPTAEGVIPVEVKSGASGSLKSMHQFLATSKGTVGVRLSSHPGGVEQLEVGLPQGGRLQYTLRSHPLYLAELLDS